MSTALGRASEPLRWIHFHVKLLSLILALMKPSHVLTLNKLKELSLIFLVSLVTKTVLHEKAVGEFSLSCELKAKKNSRLPSQFHKGEKTQTHAEQKRVKNAKKKGKSLRNTRAP